MISRDEIYCGMTGIRTIDFLSDKYHSFTSFFITRYEMVKRMFYWGWKMRWNWDFDCETLYDVIYYKLDRAYKNFIKNGHTVWCEENSSLMRKLKITRELAKRLMDDHSLKEAIRIHQQKWGAADYSSGIMNVSYKNAKTVQENELANEELRLIMTKLEKQKQKDHEQLFFLLKKYMSYWWD